MVKTMRQNLPVVKAGCISASKEKAHHAIGSLLQRHMVFFSLLASVRRLPALIALLCSLTVCASTDKGPVAYYSFNNGVAVDEAGGHQVKAVGVSFVEDRFGNPRASCYLQGNHHSYLNLGTSADLKSPAGSISLWLKIDMPMFGGQGNAVNQVILVKNSSRDDFFEAYSIAYQFVVKKLSIATTLSEFNQLTIHSSEEFPLNEWHHIVVTYDDRFTCLYIDGKLDSRMPKHFRSVFLSTDSVMVGNSANRKNNRFLCGSVDDLAYYNRVITDEDVTALYNAPDPNRSRVITLWAARILLGIALIAFVTWLIVRRYKKDLERQKEKNRIEALLNELETKAIRTQMNPHFIFNALNTLQSFILEEDIESSNKYLTKFANLLRKLIESSVSDTISLSEEIDILNRYIDLEKMRFGSSFDYQLKCEVPEVSKVFVPFMLVQPFVENAIWHGLLPKKGLCLLSISFMMLNENTIICLVDDNGVGRSANLARSNGKKRSLALEFIRQRFELLEKATGTRCGYQIVDKKDDSGKSLGTLVEITIPVINPDVARNYYRRRAESY
jgi:hypothetical protein